MELLAVLAYTGIALILGTTAILGAIWTYNNVYLPAEAARMAALGTWLPPERAVAVRNTIQQYWPANEKMDRLAERLRGPDPSLRIKTIPGNDFVEGLSIYGTNTVFISENVLGEGDVAITLVIFAEFQHIPDGGRMGEEEAQGEFVLIRDQLPLDVRTNYINGLHHRGTQN